MSDDTLQPELTDDQRAAAELREARQIIGALGRVENISKSDRRFLLSWQSYLANAGDNAVIGKYRLTILRRVIGAYQIDQALSA